MAEHVILWVRGMSCTGCEQRLAKALGRLEGVGAVTADHTSGHVRLRLDPALVDGRTLAERIETAGYELVEKNSLW